VAFASLAWLLLMVGARPAGAAFPGANGLLVVQPANGRGLLLVAPNGRVTGRICTVTARCGTPRRPRWSPDGRAIVFAAPAIRIVYPDGSCMNCRFGRASSPAFKPGGTVISFIQDRRLRLDGIDGLRQGRTAIGPATDAVWSAGGKVALVRGGAIWAGWPGKLGRIAGGSEPSWSPAGDAVAAVQGGWVVVIRVRDRRVQRVAQGTAPAFSPDGRWVAFVAPGHRLMIIPAHGNHPRPRPVGHTRAVSVDWQPQPPGPNPGCAPPPGSTVLASTPTALVTGHGPSGPAAEGFELAPPIAYMGCLRGDGRERLLERFFGNSVDGATWVASAALAAPYAALVEHSEDVHYFGNSDLVQVFDLRTGQQRNDLGGESADCPPGDGACSSGLDQLAVGTDGVSAAHTFVLQGLGPPGPDASCSLVERIVANDTTGTHVLDSITTTTACHAPAFVLSQLSLSRDTLSWRHTGTPESAQLN
jgi:hypothetical protein